MKAKFPASFLPLALLAACGGGRVPGAMTPPPVSGPAVEVSGASPAAWANGPCGMATSGAAGEAPTLGSAVQPQAVARPGSPAQIFAVWEQDRWNAIGARGMLFSASSDGGAHWSATPLALPFSTCASTTLPASQYDRISDPSISAGASVLVATALAFSAAGFQMAGGKSGVLASRSGDGGRTWSAPTSLIADTGSGAGPYYFNDRDAVAMDPNSSHVYVFWDRISSNSGGSNPTWMAHSPDGGITWDASRVIYDPGSPGQTFNNQPLVLPNGSVVDLFTSFGFVASLEVIISSDNGRTWNGPGATGTGVAPLTIATMTPVPVANPSAASAPIRDSAYMAQVAVDPSTSAIAAVWEEGSFSAGARNGIAFTISTDRGLHWSTPLQVNGRADVAAFNPSIRFSGTGMVALTYYDFRDCNAACTTTLNTGVWMRTSTDNGRTWGPDIRVAGPIDLLQAPPTDQTPGTVGNALFLGDQQGLAWNGTAWVSVFASSGTTGTHVDAVITP
jgi:hypothetical protein